MTPEQQDLFDIAERLLQNTNKGRHYKSLQLELNGAKIYLEDVYTDLMVGGPRGIVLDVTRAKDGLVVQKWDGDQAAEVASLLKQHYILDMLADV